MYSTPTDILRFSFHTSADYLVLFLAGTVLETTDAFTLLEFRQLRVVLDYKKAQLQWFPSSP